MNRKIVSRGLNLNIDTTPVEMQTKTPDSSHFISAFKNQNLINMATVSFR